MVSELIKMFVDLFKFDKIILMWLEWMGEKLV